MKQITAVLIGAGQRGADCYAPYALDNPEQLKFIAVVEPDKARREKFSRLHNIPENMQFESYDKFFEQQQLADSVLICTQDKMHYDPTLKALQKGYHVLLEKPMSPDPKECLVMGEYAKKYNRHFVICHVLRYTPFFKTLKNLLDKGRIGKLISIQHNENVGYWHQAHSFVRGNWRSLEESSPMILAKCCHDMDILLWLTDSECTRISSFGSLSYFKSENAPIGAPDRCLDGCIAEKECPYHASKIYLSEGGCWHNDVIKTVVSADTSVEALTAALKEGPYGKCVFKCDNDVVDHQLVNIEFANSVTAAFTMCAFTNDCSRTIKLMGTKGEIRGAMEKNEIEIIDFNTQTKEIIRIDVLGKGHGGGDEGLMRDFVALLREEGQTKGLTSAQVSVQSHMMSFAAEESRVSGKILDLKEYMDSL